MENFEHAKKMGSISTYINSLICKDRDVPLPDKKKKKIKERISTKPQRKIAITNFEIYE